MKVRLLAAALIVGFSWATAPTAFAATIIVREAPPPLRVEAIPAPRPGYEWGAGHWDRRGNQYVWTRGTWMRERAGYHYAAPTWVEHDGHWERHEARWDRHDDDHDGIPNGQDRHPENATRR